MIIRYSNCAGQYYPQNQQTLHRELDHIIGFQAPLGRIVKALIVPHDTLNQSGSVAASAYCQLRENSEYYKHVVILGHSHGEPFNGMVVPSVEQFQTPLGDIDISSNLLMKALKLTHVRISDDIHNQEHSIEVQLPFLQHLLPQFDLTPILVGNCESEMIAKVLDYFWNLPHTLLVLSTDLCHFQENQLTSLLDDDSRQELIGEDFTMDKGQNSVSQILEGLMIFIKQKRLMIEEVDRRLSNDMGYFKKDVTGYGSYKIL